MVRKEWEARIVEQFFAGDLQEEIVPMHAQSLHRQEMPLPGESGELLNYLKIIEIFLVYVLRKAKVKVGMWGENLKIISIFKDI